jgi:CubicO group peptidase (beta-lactamase class C family)
MSSGIAFDEDYFHPFSDINMMGYTLALGWSMDSFVASLKAAMKPGVRNHYVSMDTQVLAMILTRATLQRLSDFAEEHLWSKVGFQSDATWLLDNAADRTELAFGILGATTRDWARFGWLYLNGGVSPSLGTRILSEGWVRASLAADAPHLQPGKQNTMSDYPTFGYGYQWWLCPHPDDPARLARDYMAMGVYGQLIYVSPDYGLVIAKNAAFPHYAKLKDPESHENYLGTQGLAAMCAIARSLRNA